MEEFFQSLEDFATGREGDGHGSHTGAGDRDRTGMTFRSRDFKFEKGAYPLWGFSLLFFIFNDLIRYEK